MPACSSITWRPLGPYRALIHPAAATPALDVALKDLARMIATPGAAELLQRGRHTTVRLTLDLPAGPLDVAVKRFGRQNLIKDRIDRRRGSKACRTFTAAAFLYDRAVGAPPPVTCLERWEGGRLVDSFFVSRFLAGMTSFRSELMRLFARDPEGARFLALLETVARAIRHMHDIGFLHRDLGNQNILLSESAGDAARREVFFLDLNRGRHGRPPSDRERARDLSRITLPSGFRHIFFAMYWQATPSQAFLRVERAHRLIFACHTQTRRWRHPLRELRLRRERDNAADYPRPREQWVWDTPSEQPLPTLHPADRWRHLPALHSWHLASASLAALPTLDPAFRALRREAFAAPVPFDRPLAIAVDGATPERGEREMALLTDLGVRDVFFRFAHHATPAQRHATLRSAQLMTEAGWRVCGALAQDRRAVNDPASWEAFCHLVLAQIGWHTEWLEFAHAINRVRWGLWGLADYRRLLQPLPALRLEYPGVRFTGPAVSDFACAHTLAALRALPPGCTWDALSLHLAGDRRGAPENRQGGFSLLDQFARARAMARTSHRCSDRLIISELTWPLSGHAPASPGARGRTPGVSEDEAADYLLRLLLLATCSGFVQQTVVWKLAARGFGLTDDSAAGDWRRRPAFIALQIMQRTLAGGRFLHRVALPGTDPARVFLLACENAAAEPLLVGWSHGACLDVPAPFRLRRAHDALGRSLTLVADNRIPLSPRPCYAL